MLNREYMQDISDLADVVFNENERFELIQGEESLSLFWAIPNGLIRYSPFAEPFR
jgi:hypothetical protein